jgi:hypothetical protein
VLLESEGLYAALRDLEMPLVRVLAAMEAVGVTVDVGALSAQKLPLQRRIKQLERQVGRQLLVPRGPAAPPAQPPAHLLLGGQLLLRVGSTHADPRRTGPPPLAGCRQSWPPASSSS